MEKIKEAEGNSVNGYDDNWTVNCPGCEKEFEYTGFYDSSEITFCSCGCRFKTVKVWIDDKTYME
mgnify:CR=1 FL=1